MSDFEKRFRKMEAKLAIQEAHNKYAQGMIQASEDIFMSIWDEDAFWDMGSIGKAAGREEICKLWNKICAKKPTPNPMMINTVVTFTDEGAEAVSNNFAVSSPSEGEGKITFCAYYDEFINKDGQWLLTSRRFEPIYTVPLSGVTFSK
jgi:hypothetical protein